MGKVKVVVEMDEKFVSQLVRAHDASMNGSDTDYFVYDGLLKTLFKSIKAVENSDQLIFEAAQQFAKDHCLENSSDLTTPFMETLDISGELLDKVSSLYQE